VEDLLEDWPESEEALQKVEGFALENPLYPNLLISEDLRFTTVSLKFDTYSSLGGDSDLSGFDAADEFAESAQEERRYLTGEENNAMMAAVRRVVARYEGPGFEIFLSGVPVFTERIGNGVSGDMRRFLGLAFLASGVFLFILFRRPSGTFIPLLVVLLSLLTTLGFMPLLGIQVQVPTQVLPAFVMSVGVGDSVHILAIFYQQLRRGEGKRDAIAFSLGHSGLAVVMTTATTAGALLSFTAAELAPVAHLGVLASIGVTLALIYTLALLPAFLAVFPIREENPGARAPLAFLEPALVAVGEFSNRHPWKVVAASSAILVLAAFGAARLHFSHNPIAWFPEGDEIRADTELLNRELRGAMTMEVLFDTGRENGLHEPALLNRLEEIEELNRELRQDRIFIGKSISLVDMLKEIHQALNENRSEFYAVPQDRLLVAQELLLFENSGSDDLEDIVDSQFSSGRMTLKIPWIDAIDSESVPHPDHPGRDGLVRVPPGWLYAPDRRHRHWAGRRRYHSLHAQLPPLLRPNGRRAPGDPRDPEDHGSGPALHLSGTEYGLLHLHAGQHAEHLQLRLPDGLRPDGGIPGQRDAGTRPDDADHEPRPATPSGVRTPTNP
jgi:hypothetical protein